MWHYNPNLPWWQNLIIGFVFFGILGFCLEFCKWLGRPLKGSQPVNDREQALARLKQFGTAIPSTPEEERILAELAVSWLARKEGNAYVYTGPPPGPAQDVPDERIASQPPAASSPASDAEWHVIHSGNELGPLSLAELVGKAAVGEIDADDLVKTAGGLWTKARDFGFLQEQFVLKKPREGASQGPLEKFGGFEVVAGFVVGGGVLLVLVALAVAGVISKPTNPNPSSAEIKDARFYFDRGYAWLNKKEYDKAISDYDEAIRLDAKDAGAFINRGIAWVNKEDYGKAIKDFDEALRLDSNNALAYTNRGYARTRKKDYDKAIADYDEAIRLDPKNAFAYTSSGDAWMRKKDYDMAIKDYNEAIRLDPSYARAYCARGWAWFCKGDNDTAIKDYDEAIRLDPKDAFVYSRRGDAWSFKNNYDKAIKDYDEAIRLDPSNAHHYCSRGHAWIFKGNGDYDRAIKDCDEAIRLDPNHVDAYQHRAYAWSLKKDYDKAIKDYDEAIRLDPKDAFVYSRRGDAWMDKNAYDRAIKDYDEAIRLDGPMTWLVYSSRGKAWLNKRDYDKAIKDYDEAIRFLPSWIDYFYCVTLVLGGRPRGRGPRRGRGGGNLPVALYQ